jgi:hypothetical protein
VETFKEMSFKKFLKEGEDKSRYEIEDEKSIVPINEEDDIPKGKFIEFK